MALQLQLRPGYLFSVAGIMQLLEFVICVIILISVTTTTGFSAQGYMYFVTIASMITVLAFSLCYFFDIVNVFGSLPWSFMRLVHALFWSIFYFIAIWVAVAGSTNTNSKNRSGYIAASIFSVAELFVFLWDCVYHFYRNRNASSGGPTSA